MLDASGDVERQIRGINRSEPSRALDGLMECNGGEDAGSAEDTDGGKPSVSSPAASTCLPRVLWSKILTHEKQQRTDQCDTLARENSDTDQVRGKRLKQKRNKMANDCSKG